MSRAETARSGVLALVGEISEAELSVRLIEAMGQCVRPPGVSATDMLDKRTPPDVAAGARRQARAAIAYVAECLKTAKAPQ